MNVVVDLYDAWDKPDKAAEWRAKVPQESHEATPTESGQAPPRRDEGEGEDK